MSEHDDYDPDEFGVIAPTAAQCDNEETVMVDHSGLDPAGWYGEWRSDLIADARRLTDSIPAGVGAVRSLDATRLTSARSLLGDLADELEAARVRITELERQADRYIVARELGSQLGLAMHGEVFESLDAAQTVLRSGLDYAGFRVYAVRSVTADHEREANRA